MKDTATMLDKLIFKKVDFPENQYYKSAFTKKQIFLHHTVSGEGTEGDLTHWIQTSSRIATCLIIDREGVVWQCFSSKYWAHHLGVKVKHFRTNKIKLVTQKRNNGSSYCANNEILNQHSIGVEFDSWGWLEKKGSKFFSYTGREVAEENVITYAKPYRGKKYYEKYTKEQLATAKVLLQYWNAFYDIPMDYNEDMFDVSIDALNGKEGIWSHTSVRADKSDIHPDPMLIEMLKSL